jgi:starch synthase
LSWRPEIVHAHDWQAGLVPLFLVHQKLTDGWVAAPPSCLTIHNLAYQGVFSSGAYALTNLPWNYFHPGGAEFHGGLNCLKAGIAFGDIITTVSPRYAREITTEAYGCGLDGLLRQKQDVLIGILNGVDEEEWTTVGNPYLHHSYDSRDLTGKRLEKIDLQRELGLPEAPQVPLFGTITRLVSQKGVDLLLGALEEMLAAEMQYVLLGTGDPLYETAFLDLAQRYPNQVAVRIGYNQALAHRIEAASDFYLMPSRFEPCGLNQMYSLRYGTIPIVRVTGGLDDSIIDPSEDTEAANGIKFIEPSPRALAKAIRKALVLYQEPELLQHFRRNGMTSDHSWDHVAREYEWIYKRMLRRPTKRTKHQK